jgi:hypothetical protein
MTASTAQFAELCLETMLSRRLLRPFDPRNSRHPIDRFPLRVVIELNINIDRDSLELIGLDD